MVVILKFYHQKKVRSNRSKIIYPLCNGDDTVNDSFDKEMFDEVLASFCNKEDNK